MQKRLRFLTIFFILLLSVQMAGVLSGCTPKVVTNPPQPPKVEIPPPTPDFPPQKVMESGDFAGFLSENRKALKECGGDNRCEVPLFNLGFVHAYSRSPYYNQSKAIRYLEELVKKYPQSPYAFQARAWLDLMRRQIASESKRKRLQGEVKSKDTTINELQQQMKRSREIDEEMEQKERELLQ